MTLPAHRFRDREDPEERKKGKGKGKQHTWTFDYDETITKAPKQCARIAKGLRKLGDQIVVVTGNQSPRDQLTKNLKAFGFPFDDLIQYEDDQSDGIRRLEILEQLNAWGAFDDRTGRAPTLTQQCPHFFLSAEPSKAAKKKAKGAKKAAKKATKGVRSESRAAAQEPPGYRLADDPAVTCDTCVFMDRSSGMCRRYGVMVDRQHVCDTWEAEDDE